MTLNAEINAERNLIIKKIIIKKIQIAKLNKYYIKKGKILILIFSTINIILGL